MSIALGNHQIPNECLKSKITPFDLSHILDHKDQTVVRVVVKEERENGHHFHHDHDHQSCSSSSSSSSIGINSDDENENENGEEIEVESKLKNPSFDSTVNALEQALPLRRGISNFYNGKSKSFASLTDASACSSIEDITKPENAYSRKRKNLLAYNMLYNKGRFPLLKAHATEGGIIRRSTSSSRSTIALGDAINNHETSIDENETNVSHVEPVCPPLPAALPPHPWRSFSVVDLQHCGVSASAVKFKLSSPLMGKRNKCDDEVS